MPTLARILLRGWMVAALGQGVGFLGAGNLPAKGLLVLGLLSDPAGGSVCGMAARDRNRTLAGEARKALDHYRSVTYPGAFPTLPGGDPLRPGQLPAHFLDSWHQDDELDLDEDLDPAAVREHLRRSGRLSAVKLAAGLDQAAMAALSAALEASPGQAGAVFLESLGAARSRGMKLQEALDAAVADGDYSRGQMRRLLLDPAPDPSQEDPLGLCERLGLDIEHQQAVGDLLAAAKARYVTHVRPLLAFLAAEAPRPRKEEARVAPAPVQPAASRPAAPGKSRRERLREKIRARRHP